MYLYIHIYVPISNKHIVENSDSWWRPQDNKNTINLPTTDYVILNVTS